MERFNFQVFKRFWAIAKAYWFGDEKWKARGGLLLIFILLLAYTGLSVVLNNQRGELISALSAKSESRFWHTVVIFMSVIVAYAPVLAGYNYLRDRLGLAWRKWLTERFLDRYFGDRAYYQINQFERDIDNPDQRIAEDVRSFTQESLTLALVLGDSILEIIAFSGVLLGISKPLVAFLLLYALVGTFATVGVFGQPLVRLNFEQLKKEANFRFSLVRVRENAEAIAFYQGEDQEAGQIKERFMAAFNNYKRLLLWQLGLNGITNAYEFLPFVLPAIVVAPAVFGGEVEVGKVSEAQGAFLRVFFSLNVIVARFQSLTAFGAGIDRLYSFAEALGHVEDEQAHEILETAQSQKSDSQSAEKKGKERISGTPSAIQPTIQRDSDPELVLQHLTLQTPNYQRTLIEDLSLTVGHGSSLLVMGPSGCGKSSLMRAIAGLWDSGAGTIKRPPLGKILFLPQKPYMVLGNLRDQLRYPYPKVDIEDEMLLATLQQVNLPTLAERFGGLEAEEEWGDVLSLGEQQRLSFARILLHKPVYTILDEATSALDDQNEKQLYKHLASCSGSYLSVGHRNSLTAYHQYLLRLEEDHAWQIVEL